MVKIKNFLKKNMKVLITTFTITICSFLVIGKVNAEEISQFCEYSNPCISEEIIDELITNNNVDTSVNDEYLLVAYLNSNGSKYYHLILFNSENMKNGINYIDTSGTITFIGTDIININTTNLDSGSTFYTSTNTWVYGISNKEIPEGSVYYATMDILDQDGNIILPKNNIEPIPEEDPNVTNTRIFLEQFASFSKQIYTLIGSIVSTIIQTPLLMMPFGLCILGVIIAVFYKLFSRR